MATTWNPADITNVILSNGNLTGVSTAQGGVRSIASVAAGKYYFEVTFGATGTLNQAAFGVANASATVGTAATTGVSVAVANGAGATAINGTAQTNIGAFSYNGTCCIALDVGGIEIWFRNGAAGNWNGSGTADPATGVGGYPLSTLTGGAATLYAYAGTSAGTATSWTANFGGGAFVGAVPSGFNGQFGPATQALLTQVAAEQWAAGGAAAQATQIGLEMWALSGAGTGTQALLTQVAIEEWAAAGAAPPAVAARVWVMA